MRLMLVIIMFAGFLYSSEYVVKKGDTLWDISIKYYKTGFKWSALYDANKDIINNPDLIYPDMKLKIPFIEEKTEVQKENTFKVPFVEEKNEVKDIEKNNEVQVEDKKDLKTEKSESEIIEIIDENELSKKLPDNQFAFNLGRNKIKVSEKFIDGEILSKETDDEFDVYAQMDDNVLIKLYDKKIEVNPGDKMNIFMLVRKEKDKLILEKTAECVITRIEKYPVCRVTKLSNPVEKGMLVKLWKK